MTLSTTAKPIFEIAPRFLNKFKQFLNEFLTHKFEQDKTEISKSEKVTLTQEEVLHMENPNMSLNPSISQNKPGLGAAVIQESSYKNSKKLLLPNPIIPTIHSPTQRIL